MSLQKQTIDIPIVGGIEGNAEALVRTRLESCSNGQMRKRGGISKRFGTKRLSSPVTNQFGASTPPPAAETLAASGHDCIRVGVGEVSSYSKTLNAVVNGQRVYRDQISECTATYDFVAGGTKSYVHPDVAKSASGYLVYVYRDSVAGSIYGTIYASVVDATTLTPLMDRVAISATANNNSAHVVIIGTTALVVFADNANNILGTKLDLANLVAGWTAPGVIVADCAAPATLDVCLSPTGTSFNIAYALNAGANRVMVREISTNLAVVANRASADAFVGTFRSVGIVADANRIWVAWSYTTGGNDIIRASIFTPTLSAETAGPTTFESNASAPIQSYAQAIGMCLLTTTQCAIAWSGYSGWCGVDLLSTALASLLPNALTNTCVPNFSRLQSKPWVQDGKVFCAFATGGDSVTAFSDPGSLYVVDTNCSRTAAIWSQTPMRVVASVAPRQVNFLQAIDGCPLSSAVSLGGAQWLFAAYSSFTGNAGVGGSVVGVTATFNRPRQVVESSGITLLTGGVPSTYDGKLATEIGFHERPRIYSAAIHAPPGTGLMSAGSVSLRAVLEWPDATGRVVRSQPSAAVVVNGLIALDALDLTFQVMGPSAKMDAENGYKFPIGMVLYRTVSGGTAYHRASSNPYVITTTPLATTSAAMTTGTFTDSDVNILTYPELYTEGGILDNVAPPSAQFATVYRNRFWLAGTPDDTIWYSKTVTPFEGLGFNEGLTIPAFEGGRVVAIGALENALIVFKANAIYNVQGDGADDTGNGSSLSEPQRISSDTGCVDARTVVLTPDGLMFQSARGIYLLSRDFVLTFIGEDVANYTQEALSTITSAVLVPSQSIVRFTRSFSASESTANVLVYDYLHRIWTTANYYDQQVSLLYPIAGACIVDGAWRYVTASGQEYEEDTSTYLDGGSVWVTLLVRTSWIKLAGVLQGYQRVWRARFLSERQSSHGVTLTAEVNFDPSTSHAKVFDETVFDALVPERVEVSPVPQRCDAIRLSWQDTPRVVFGPGYGTGQGSILEGVTLEYGVQPGIKRGVAAAQKG